MTRRTNARVAGVMLLLYIAVGVAQMVVGRGIVRSQGTAAMLSSMLEHTTAVRTNVLLGLLTTFVAFALGIALHGLTREHDRELATLALVCRAAEGVVGALPGIASLGLLWLGSQARAGVPAESIALSADLIVKLRGMLPTLGATLFAVGSVIFSYLLLRGRVVPKALAALGVAASAVLTVLLPLQLTGSVSGAVTQYMWAPMAVFEVALAGWFLVKGAGPPRVRTTAD